VLACWQFSEGEGNATVEAVSGIHDAVRRPMWTEGASGAGLAFDGLSTAVTHRAAVAPKLPPEFTIEAWVAVREYPAQWAPFVNQHRYPDAGFFFGLNEAGIFGLHLSVGGQWRLCNSAIALPKGKWAHIAAAYGAEGYTRLYINGQLTGEAGLPGGVPTADDVDLVIGMHNSGASGFDGIIDELKIHKRALGAMEIVVACGASAPPNGPQFPARREYPPGVEADLLAWWPFSEGKGDETEDPVTGARDAITGAEWVAGAQGKGLAFDGEEGSVLRSAADAPFLPGGFTLEAWVAVRGYPRSWAPIIEHHAADAGYSFGLDERGFFGLRVSAGGQWHECLSDVKLDKGRWVHLSAFHHSGGDTRIYINGRLAGQLWAVGVVEAPETADLAIGGAADAGTFDGIIDEIKLRGRAVSAEELVILCAMGAPAGEPEFP